MYSIPWRATAHTYVARLGPFCSFCNQKLSFPLDCTLFILYCCVFFQLWLWVSVWCLPEEHEQSWEVDFWWVTYDPRHDLHCGLREGMTLSILPQCLHRWTCILLQTLYPSELYSVDVLCEKLASKQDIVPPSLEVWLQHRGSKNRNFPWGAEFGSAGSKEVTAIL